MGSSPLTRGKPRPIRPRDLARRLIPAHAGKTAPDRRRRYQCRAHPRSRGENSAPGERAHVPQGSSPLTRGKRFRVGGYVSHGGLIPAHAGKTGVSFIELQGAWAHPRSRGENLISRRLCGVGWGSSPLTRGKPALNCSACKRAGLIPAHAGKTPAGMVCSASMRAHPRSRGENLGCSASFCGLLGSSPLTRGKPISARMGQVLWSGVIVLCPSGWVMR